MSVHSLRRLRPFGTSDMYVAECTQDDYEGEPGSPALVGRKFYEHLDEMNRCLLCLRPGTHRFSAVDGPDGLLCEKHKDDPVGNWGESARRG